VCCVLSRTVCQSLWHRVSTDTHNHISQVVQPNLQCNLRLPHICHEHSMYVEANISESGVLLQLSFLSTGKCTTFLQAARASKFTLGCFLSEDIALFVLICKIGGLYKSKQSGLGVGALLCTASSLWYWGRLLKSGVCCRLWVACKLHLY
jgi:hypothetical protein